MDHLTGIEIDEDVVQVAIAEADYVADDWHHRDRVRVVFGRLPPAARVYTVAPDLSVECKTG